MTAAIALAREGVAVDLVEIEQEWRPAGVGLGLHSPPLRALKSLDLFDAVVAAGRPHPELDMRPAGGALIATNPQPNVNEPGDPPFVALSRVALHGVLEPVLRAAGTAVRVGTTVDALEQRDGVVRA